MRVRNFIPVLLVALAAVFVIQSAQYVINTGPFMDSGLGEAHFTAFQKVNSNFTELYANVATASLTNTFDANQFTLVNGTNVHFGPTALVTNLNLYGNTTNFGTLYGLPAVYTNVFNANQFSIVNGTNVDIKDGAMVTNLQVNSFTNIGDSYQTGPKVFLGDIPSATNTARVTITDPTNPLRIERDNSGAGTVAQFYNPNTTDGNSVTFAFLGNTTGGGALAGVSFVNVRATMTVHDNATKNGDYIVLTAGPTLTEKMRVTGGGNVGVNTTGPDRRLDVLDTSGPQIRLTYANESTYTDLQTDVSGNYTVTASGGKMGVGVTPLSTLDVNGAIGTPIFTKTTNYTLAVTDDWILGDATASNIVFTLPAVATAARRKYTIKRINSGANTVTIQTTANKNIDHLGTNVTLTTQDQALNFKSDGTQWWMN